MKGMATILFSRWGKDMWKNTCRMYYAKRAQNAPVILNSRCNGTCFIRPTPRDKSSPPLLIPAESEGHISSRIFLINYAA